MIQSININKLSLNNNFIRNNQRLTPATKVSFKASPNKAPKPMNKIFSVPLRLAEVIGDKIRSTYNRSYIWAYEKITKKPYDLPFSEKPITTCHHLSDEELNKLAKKYINKK